MSKRKPKDDLENLNRNFRYCLNHARFFRNKKLAERAAAFPVAVSTLTRWLAGTTGPGRRSVDRLAELLRISDSSILYSVHDEFKDHVIKIKDMIVDYKDVRPEIHLGSIEKWKDRWPECFQKHLGSYILYTRLLSSSTEKVAKSLLQISELTERGISFNLFNVDDRHDRSRPAIYNYVGLLFPIFECLIFYGEERSGDEPLCLISSSSQVNTPSLLIGALIAVGVDLGKGIRMPNGTKAVLSFQGRKITEVAAVQKTLGIRNRADIEAHIGDLLFGAE